MTEETERIYVIPLKKKYFPASNAAPTAVKRVKQYINRHMKVDETDIWIDESLNHAIWSKGKYKMPSKIRVKAVRFEDGVVEVYLPELEFEKSRREILQEERAKKQPILRKEEAGAPEEGVDEAGTDDYEVVPTADGDVKLKKKKHESAEDEEEESEEGKEAEEKEEASSEKEEDEKESKDSAETTEEKKPKEEKDSEESSESTKESEEDEKKDQS